MWTVRTEREGSKALLTDYQKNIIRKLIIVSTIEETIKSGEMWTHLNKVMGDKAPSRASVIFFLNDLVKYGYADFKDATSKGGHVKMYYSRVSKEQFEKKVYIDINNKLKDALDKIFI